MDHLHFNPVKQGLAEHPADWPHSSFGQWVEGGQYPDGWRAGSDEPQETGERLRDPRVAVIGGMLSYWSTEGFSNNDGIGMCLRFSVLRIILLLMSNNVA